MSLTIAILLSNVTGRPRIKNSGYNTWFFNKGEIYMSSCFSPKYGEMYGGHSFPSIADDRFRIPYTHLKVKTYHKGEAVTTALQLVESSFVSETLCKTLQFPDPERGNIPFEFYFDLRGKVGKALGLSYNHDWSEMEEILFTGTEPTTTKRVDGSTITTGENVEPTLREETQIHVTFDTTSTLVDNGYTQTKDGKTIRVQLVPDSLITLVKVVKKGASNWREELTTKGVELVDSFSDGEVVTLNNQPVTLKEASQQSSIKTRRKNVEKNLRFYWNKHVWSKMTPELQHRFEEASKKDKLNFIIKHLKSAPDWGLLLTLEKNKRKKVLNRLLDWKVKAVKVEEVSTTIAIDALSQGIKASNPKEEAIEDIFTQK